MNIFNKVTLQAMRKSRTRTIVTIVGVILSAAMITAVATFAVSIQDYLIKGSIIKYGDWHVEFFDVDEAFANNKADEDAVKSTVSYDNIGYSILEGCTNPDKPYLFVAGFDNKALDVLPVNMISGRLPENDTEVIIPAHVASNGGVTIAVGDKLALNIGNRKSGDKILGQNNPYTYDNEELNDTINKTYKVVGIYERPTYELPTAPGYTLITKSCDNVKSDSRSIFVSLKNPLKIQSYAKNESDSYGYVLNDSVLRFMGVSNESLFNTLLYTVGAILVILIMIGSVFMIYNSFNISLNERTRQFGILASVGATEKQLRNSVLFEGLCIGTVGIPVGILVGLGSVKLVIVVIANKFVKFAYGDVQLSMKISILALIAAAVVSLITIMISAYIPAKKAAATPVMECIRQTNEVKIESKEVTTSKLTSKMYGLEGMLALKSFKRNKKRYRSIVLSLTLSVVLFVSASSFGMYLKKEAKASVIDADYDICFSTKSMEEKDVFKLYDKLKNADGVYKSSYQSIITYSMAVNARDFCDRYRKLAGYSSDESDNYALAIQFIEDSEYEKYLKDIGLSIDDYTGDNAKITVVAKAMEYNEETKKSNLYNIFKEGSINATLTSVTNDVLSEAIEKKVDITFVDTIPLDTLPRDSEAPESTVFMAVVPYQLKDRFEVPGEYDEYGLTFLSNKPSMSTGQMEKIIKEDGLTSEYNLLNIYKILDENRNMIFVVDVFTYVFIVMISLIAVANVFNTISTNIKLRRRELAMLRSVGMSDRDFQRMMNFECVFYGMRTLLYGLPIAGILSWLIYKGIMMGGDELEYIFPLKSMVISIVGVFFVVFITMLYSISKIKKENIIEALRDDMT